jgi:hypothetical protein
MWWVECDERDSKPKTQIGNMGGAALNWTKYFLGCVLILNFEKYLHTTYNSFSIFLLFIHAHYILDLWLQSY